MKYGSTYYNTFTMGICSNYHGYFFQCTRAKQAINIIDSIDTYSSTLFLFL